MEKNKIFNLFKSFIGGDTIEIGGLYLKPERIIGNTTTIEFSIDNPNDTSFYLGVVNEYLDDILFDFSKFVNHKFKYHIDTNYPEIYFNETLKNDIKKVLQSITTLKLSREYSSHTIIAEIKGHSVGFNVESNYDQINIWNEFDAKSGKVYNETTNTILTTDLNECVENYIGIIESYSAYLESDTVYQELDMVLEDYPLISTEWIAQVYHTGFTNL
jgi:hypothetical protein